MYLRCLFYPQVYPQVDDKLWKMQALIHSEDAPKVL